MSAENRYDWGRRQDRPRDLGPPPPNLDFYIYASDPDNALEVAGAGADEEHEFETVEQATELFDPEYHGGKRLYRIRVEEVHAQE